MKIDLDFVKKSYTNLNVVNSYAEKRNEYGLSNIEKKIIIRYFTSENLLLDVGCGTGRVSFGLHELGFKNITGIDISNEMINEACCNKSEIHKELKFHVQDVLDLQYEKNYFDGAIAFHGITPIPKRENRKKALLEIKKVLKNEGVIILSTFLQNPHDEFWQKEIIKWKSGNQDKVLNDFGDIVIKKDDSTPIFIHIPSDEDFRKLLHETGYELLFQCSWEELVDSEVEIHSAQKCQYWVAKAKK